jgi:7-cyano-7-deazaguanine reductase
MSEVKNYNKVQEIAGKHLGKVGGEGYKDTYDPSLLVPIPRKLNREAYGIQEDNLPFKGYDVWNAYEVSAITEKGLPVSGMLKITCPADTEYHVESKSIKLYLNSFNMTPIGKDTKECIDIVEARVSRDLTELLGGPIVATFFQEGDNSKEYIYEGYTRIQDLTDLDKVEFTTYKSDHNQLESSNKSGELKVSIDFVRSNCRVTNQPDFGTMFLYIKGKALPTLDSLAKYVVSHRQVSHFHEEIVEMTFTHLQQAFNPDAMMVDIHYSRRGGIDINPVRATHSMLIADFMINPAYRMKKVLKQ